MNSHEGTSKQWILEHNYEKKKEKKKNSSRIISWCPSACHLSHYDSLLKFNLENP